MIGLGRGNMSLSSRIIRRISRNGWRLLNSWRFKELGVNSFVSKPIKITPWCIVLRDNVSIHSHCRIQGVMRYGDSIYEPEIVFDDHSSCQQNLHLTCAKRIYVGKETAIAANVTITDINHRYEDINLPVERQPLEVSPVQIGEGCKIYNNAVILPGTIIGDHCVVGANSVVTKSIPGGCVVAGVPARVIRQYDAKTGLWLPGSKGEGWT